MKKALITSFCASLASALFVLSPATMAANELFDTSAYKGQVVVLDFWASWCGPCRKSFPWLNTMQEKYADDGLVVIGVNVDAQRSDADAFLAQYPSKFHIVYDPAGTLASHYSIMGMPSSIILDRDGNIVERHTGFREKKRDFYEESLLRHLKPTRTSPSEAAKETG